MIKIKNVQKKFVDHNTGALLLIHWVILQHVAVQRDNLQVIDITKVTMNRHWVMGGLYINWILVVQLINYGVYRCHFFLCRFCGKWTREYFFSLF